MFDDVDLRRQFAWVDWAHRETLGSLRTASDAVPQARRLLAHVLAAEALWQARIDGAPAPLPVWPELTLAQCEALLPGLRTGWVALLDRAGEAALARVVTYVNSKGEPWESRVRDIVTHVVLHGHYHRGQIASLVRAAGFEPAYTDFIHAARRGLLA